MFLTTVTDVGIIIESIKSEVEEGDHLSCQVLMSEGHDMSGLGFSHKPLDIGLEARRHWLIKVLRKFKMNSSFLSGQKLPLANHSPLCSFSVHQKSSSLSAGLHMRNSEHLRCQGRSTDTTCLHRLRCDVCLCPLSGDLLAWGLEALHNSKVIQSRIITSNGCLFLKFLHIRSTAATFTCQYKP